MSWGTDFKTEIFLSHESYASPEEVNLKVKELEENIQTSKAKIKMFVSSNPKDIIPEDWKEEPIRWLEQEANNLLDEISEDELHVYKLQLYLESLNK